MSLQGLGLPGRMFMMQGLSTVLELKAAEASVGCARLSVRELGWPLRLGTAMTLKTILFFNKILLLPDLHPVKTLLRLALQLPCESWASRARALMNDPRLASPIPTIFEWGEIPDGLLQVAAQDAAVRKNALRRYKVGVVFRYARLWTGKHTCKLPQNSSQALIAALISWMTRRRASYISCSV